MNCSRFETTVTDYLDQVLEPQVQAAALEHLQGCPQCASLLADVRHFREELGQFPVLPVPEGLVDRILEKTSGKPRQYSLWQDLVVPTVSPFLSQRFAFATVIMFVFLSLMVNLLSPEFSAFSSSSLKPSSIAEQADRWSNQVVKKWLELKDLRSRFIQELKLLKEDLSGRLDYHLLTILFKSYNDTLQEQHEKQPQEQPGQDADAKENKGPTGDKK